MTSGSSWAETSSPDGGGGGRPALLVVFGSLACVVGVAAIVIAFPALARYDTRDWIEAQQAVAVN